MCCIYNHGCEVIHCNVLSLPRTIYTLKGNYLSLPQKPVSPNRSCTDRGRPPQELLLYPCWTLTSLIMHRSCTRATTAVCSSVQQCERAEPLWEPFLHIGRKNLLTIPYVSPVQWCRANRSENWARSPFGRRDIHNMKRFTYSLQCIRFIYWFFIFLTFIQKWVDLLMSGYFASRRLFCSSMVVKSISLMRDILPPKFIDTFSVTSL